MSDHLLLIGVALTLDGLAGLAGGLLSDRWLFRHQSGLVGFAAGALLSAVFLDVLPESLASLGGRALELTLAGFVALAIIEWASGHHHHGEPDGLHKVLPFSLLTSDALHNIGDGAALAAGFMVSTRVGLAVSVAIVVHEVPQEVGDYALLRATGFSRGHALLALTGVQLTAVVGAAGALLAQVFFSRANGAILSLSAGTFLYIGATDLLPEVHSGRTGRERSERILGFLAGIVLIVLASLATR